MGSINKTILVGRVGSDPKIEQLGQTDKLVAKFSLATNEKWKDKDTGETKSRAEWHQVVVYDQLDVKNIEQYVKKGDQIGVEGKNETRSWEKDGVTHYRTEVVVRPGSGNVTFLDTAPAPSNG